MTKRNDQACPQINGTQLFPTDFALEYIDL